jgi:hypothetical protein
MSRVARVTPARPTPTRLATARLATARIAATTLLAAGALAGCAGGNYPTTPVPTTSSASTTSSTATTAPTCDPATATETYEPLSGIPATSSIDDEGMRTIIDRGRLVVGVSADTYLLAARNPLTNSIEGFDIDIAKAIAKAIFGDENKVTWRVITAGRSHSAAAVRRSRPRRAQYDDDVRAVAGHRLLGRVLPRRPEGPRRAGLERRDAGGSQGSTRLRAVRHNQPDQVARIQRR